MMPMSLSNKYFISNQPLTYSNYTYKLKLIVSEYHFVSSMSNDIKFPHKLIVYVGWKLLPSITILGAHINTYNILFSNLGISSNTWGATSLQEL